MGQKVHPYSFRLGPQYTWRSRWFAQGTQYKQLLQQDYVLRQFLQERLRSAGLMEIEIERSIRRLQIRLFVMRPGVVIGRGGSGIEELKKQLTEKLQAMASDRRMPQLDLIVEEVNRPELSAQLMAQRMVDQLSRRIPHSRAANRLMEQIMASGALGVMITLAGRINGSEIGRTEKHSMGSVPRQTIRADVDFARVPALTKSGYVGVKVWIHRPVEE